MNARIQELAKEAQQYAEWTTPQGLEWFGAFKQRFAELIVRECVDIADDYVKDCMCDEHKNCKHPQSIIGRKIREHFGVQS